MISVPGIGSGLDVDSLVTQLVAAERAPVENRLLRNDARLTSDLSAFGQFKSALAAFQDSLRDVGDIGSYGQRVGNSDNNDLVGVSVSAAAPLGSFSLDVDQLASSQSLASKAFASKEQAIGTGTLTFRFGTTDYTSGDPGPQSYDGFIVNPDRGAASITIDSSNNTLEGIRDAINGADIGVSAAIVNDGSGYRLLFNTTETGARNSVAIVVDDTGDNDDSNATGLSAFAFNDAAANLTQTVAAQDAQFSINGLAISSAQNSVNDAIEGVELNLKGITTKSAIINVSEDRGRVSEAINRFIQGYNRFVTTANTLTAFDAESSSSGALQGDFSARSIIGQLRAAMTSTVDGVNVRFSTLSEIGITTAVDGTMSVDRARLDEALATDFDTIAGLFATVGRSTDSGAEFLSATEDTAVGSIGVTVTQMATQGQLTGSSLVFPLTIDGDSDGLVVRINGTESASLELTQGLYATGTELAAEIQSVINGDEAIRTAGALVDVVVDNGGLTLRSRQYGSGSSVEITGLDGQSTAVLGLSVASGIAGLDVAGSLGGVVAMGSGQVLTGVAGSAADGLRVQIDSGTVGARGTVDFSRGLGSRLDGLLSEFLASDGILETRTNGIQAQVEQLDEDRAALDRRISVIEAQYRARFTALDTLLSQLQGTSNFLSQQLAALPQPNSINRN